MPDGILNVAVDGVVLLSVTPPDLTSQRSKTYPLRAVAVMVTRVPGAAVDGLALAEPHEVLFTSVVTVPVLGLKCALTETLFPGILNVAVAEVVLLSEIPPDKTSHRSNSNPVRGVAVRVTRVP